MTREERLAILGPAAVAEIRERVALAPDPSPELVEKLRRLWTNEASPAPEPQAQPANSAADAAA